MKAKVMAALVSIPMLAPATGAALAKDTKKVEAPVKHSAASIKCSKEADAKGLHGKEREKFRAECKRALGKR